jgi:hypothetical protein
MVEHAAKSAAQPSSSLKAPSVASVSCQARTEVCSRASFYGAFTAHEKAAVEVNIRRRGTEDDLVHLGSSASYPVLCSGSRFGPVLRPAAGSLFCFGFATLRVTVSTFGGHSVNAASALGAGASRWLRQV